MGKFLLVIAVFGLLVYTLFWLVERRRRKRSARRSSFPPVPYKRNLGPDDDVEFLREIEQRRRRAAHDKQQADESDKKPPKEPGQPA